MRFKYLPFLIVLATAPCAMAFDGRREGFIMGVAFGPHFCTFDETDNFGPADIHVDGQGVSWAGDVLFGGSGGKLSLYGVFNTTWLLVTKPHGDGFGNLRSGEVQKSIRFLGAGINHYLADSPRAKRKPYVTLKVGEMFHSEEGVYQGRSLGFQAGGGVEFKRHWAFELRVYMGNPEETERSLEFFSVQAMVSAIAF